MNNTRELQLLSLHMLIDFKKSCEILDLTYMLGGGSLLGCIRHNGFIPWDDDIDIMMPRESYKKFISYFEEVMGDNYYIEVPNSKYDIHRNIMRLYKKGIIGRERGGHENVNDFCIDIHPIDYAPNNKIKRCIKGGVASFLNILAASCRLYKTHSKETKVLYNKSIKRKLDYFIGVAIGSIFRFVNYKKIYDLFDSFIQGDGETNYMTIAAGRGGGYIGECLPKKVFLPVKRHRFENIDVDIPNDYDKYLKNLYGDYMNIPPESKREHHYMDYLWIDSDIKWNN